MKHLPFLIALLGTLNAPAQTMNKAYVSEQNSTFTKEYADIVANEVNTSIQTKVIYNALPDGYHITYTTSFIGNDPQDVEMRMNTKIDNLIKKTESLNITKKEVAVDILSLDPVFDFKQSDSLPVGYKITENITFTVKRVDQIRELSRICLEFDIYDMINAQAFLLNSKPIYDSLAHKAIEILNSKKKLCADAGLNLAGGKPSISKKDDVYYPSEHYLRTLIKNSSLYKHHVSQNSELEVQRRVEVDNYYNLNLKDADYVFNSGITSPVIQFYYELNYNYEKPDTEAQMREKIRKEEEKKQEKVYYILDKNGNLKKIE